MMPRPNHLHLVHDASEKIVREPPPAPGDLALLAALLGLNLVPLCAFALRLGTWSPATLGFAAACSVVCGRELAIEASALVRARREGSRWTR